MKLSIDDRLPRLPTTTKLATGLRITRREATGLIVELWAWALKEYEGEIPANLPPANVAAAVDWYSTEPAVLMECLLSCKVLVPLKDDPTALEFKDFQRYNGYMLRERRRRAGKPRRVRLKDKPEERRAEAPVEESSPASGDTTAGPGEGATASAPGSCDPAPPSDVRWHQTRELAVKLLKLGNVKDVDAETINENVSRVVARPDFDKMTPFAAAKMVVDGCRS